MSTVKERMIKIINEQPEDSSFTELLQELSFTQMIERELQDSKNNRVTHEKDFIKETEKC